MSYQTIHVKRDGSVVFLALNRPTVRNAFNEELMAELTAWARETATLSEVRAVVITGAGPAFCAGADLAWMARVAAYSDEDNRRDAHAAADMFDAIDRLPMAVIGRVHGAAIGGGAGLAAVCDVVVSDTDAVFGFTEAKLGLVAAVISPFVARKIGHSAARHLFVTGARFSATHAREIGLVHAVVERDTLDDRVGQYLREVLSGGPEAIAAAKALLRRVAEVPGPEVRNLTTTVLAERRSSAEGKEGIQAFLEKRKPSWSEPR